MNWEVGIGPGAYYHSEWEAAVPRRELSSALCDARGPGGGGSKRERMCVYMRLIHVVQQKLTQHCKAIIMQLKKPRN